MKYPVAHNRYVYNERNKRRERCVRVHAGVRSARSLRTSVASMARGTTAR